MKKENKQSIQDMKNPFLYESFIKVYEVTSTNKMVNVSDIQDGIITKKPSELTSKFLVETDSNTKIYNKPTLRLHISCLSDNAKSLFLWITYELDKDLDYIELDTRQVRRYISENTKSHVAFNKAVKELEESGILKESTINKIYWINPIFFFNGNRIKKYPDFISE